MERASEFVVSTMMGLGGEKEGGSGCKVKKNIRHEHYMAESQIFRIEKIFVNLIVFLFTYTKPVV